VQNTLTDVEQRHLR